MTGPSLFGKLLKRRMVNSNSPERTPRKRQSRSFVNAKCVARAAEEFLPGQIHDDSDHSEGEQPPGAAQPVALLEEDEGMHLRWEKVLAGRPASKLSRKELRALEDTNMPLKHRHTLWPKWFTAPNVNDIDALQASIPKDAAAAIEADIERTQPQRFGAPERAALRRVLRAYAAGNPAVGYCQGMNNIAAVFIMLGFDEAAALRGCYTLLQGCCPGYHDRDLAGFRLDAQVLAVLVKSVLPKGASQRLDALDIPLDVLASEHFLTLASKSWPLATTARLWDLVLQEGSPAVFASYLALLNLYLPDDQVMAQEFKLAPAGEAPEPVEVFRRRARQGVADDSETVLREVRRLIPLVSQTTINHLRFSLAGKKC